jgi:hypothetical protein
MRTHKCLWSTFTVLVAAAFTTAAIAADLPKEGTYSGMYSNPGTYKAYPVGKERVAVSWEADGATVGTGFLDHTTWHCFGLEDVASGAQQWHGYCILTDPAGDQIMTSVISERHTQDAKNFGATGTFTAGTGKFTGIEGGITLLCHNNAEFRTAAAGTYVFLADLKAGYKLP